MQNPIWTQMFVFMRELPWFFWLACIQKLSPLRGSKGITCLKQKCSRRDNFNLSANNYLISGGILHPVVFYWVKCTGRLTGQNNLQSLIYMMNCEQALVRRTLDMTDQLLYAAHHRTRIYTYCQFGKKSTEIEWLWKAVLLKAKHNYIGTIH